MKRILTILSQKWPEYILEIIVITIGILGAFSLNNWNENRKTRKDESFTLVAIQEEFRTNQRILQQTVNELEGVIEAIELLTQHTGPQINTEDEALISEYMRLAFKPKVRAYFGQGALSEVINSGKLDLISNANLRIRLSNWQALVNRKKEQENYVFLNGQQAHDFYLTHGNFRRHLHIVKEADGDWFQLGSGKHPSNNFDFLTNQEFENRLMVYLASLTNLKLNFYQPIQSEIEAILDQLSASTKNRSQG